MDITVLIMSESKTHSAKNESMRHQKYGLVDLFDIGKIQKQLNAFYTIDVSGVPVETLEQAKDLILPAVYSEPTIIELDQEPEILHRRRFVLDMSIATVEELSELEQERHLNLSWERAFDLFKDVTK
jgi:hypothetical protein